MSNSSKLSKFFKLTKLSKLFEFSVSEWWLFVVSWFTYLKWDLLISLFKYSRWKQQLGDAQPIDETVDFTLIQKLIVINEKAGRNHFRKMNCLRRCLCQKEMLAKRNIQSVIHIGVKIVSGKLEAHSWLTCNQVLINDSDEEINKYKELSKLNDIKSLMLFN